MSKLTFTPATTPALVEQMAALGREIWLDYWPALIGREQTEYMLETMHSAEAIQRSIDEEGYVWLFVSDEAGTVVGYSSAAPEHVDANGSAAGAYDPTIHGRAINDCARDRLFISKIYLRAGERGKHYSTAIVEHWAAYAREHGLMALYLTVNKGNELGTRAYTHQGFKSIESRESDIGNGYIMDDYVMMKRVD
jgi:GNAT superfamily N-acetyltransferase